MTLALLNTTIATVDGTFQVSTISVDEARKMVAKATTTGGGIQSFIGHPATVEIVSTILGIPIELHRGMFRQKLGQQALCFKLNGRPTEGHELTLAELEEIGFTWKVMTRIS
jgi:hypothetical protein